MQRIKSSGTSNDLYDTNNYEVSKVLEEVSARDLIDDMLSGNTNIVDSTQTMGNTHRNVNLNLGEDNQVYSDNLEEYIDTNDFLRDDRGFAVTPFFKGTAAPTINLENNYGLQASMGGPAATTEWKSKREAVLENREVEREKAINGSIEPIYEFDKDVLDLTDLEVKKNQIKTSTGFDYKLSSDLKGKDFT